uniref:Oxidoreductase, short-chain dehydrogenase family n=1 Tax=Piliocolobus tephrosceles TaxID=591936 RepID=A0A8C9LJB2_9PRIM
MYIRSYALLYIYIYIYIRMCVFSSFQIRNRITCVELDLSSYKSIEKCANTILGKVDKIDIIINNAGFMKKNHEYIDNIESHFFINYLGHFYLTHLLYNCILKSNTLVINLSSFAHCMLIKKDVDFKLIFKHNTKKSNSNLLYRREYYFSKLCMLYFSQQLQAKLEKENTTACSVSVNPGFVKTYLFKHEALWFRCFILNYCFPKTPLQGAQTIL